MNWKDRWRTLPNQWKIVIIVVGIALLIRIIGLPTAPAQLKVVSINPIISGEFFLDSPCWSPDGKRIAFSTSAAIWTINPDGTGLKRILEGDLQRLSCISDLSWSSKGIIFCSQPGILLIDSERRNSMKVLNKNKGSYNPTWSPDGKKIAYTVYRFDKKGRPTGSNVWIMNVDGTNQHQLISMKSSDPCWFQDGRKIAFIGKKDGKNVIFIADSDGGNIKLLTKEFVGGIKDLSWSPDGEWIVYTYMMAFGANREIKVVRTDGRCKQTLTRPQIDAYDPSWSPDGSRIAFVKAQPGGYSGEDTYSICIMTLER